MQEKKAKIFAADKLKNYVYGFTKGITPHISISHMVFPQKPIISWANVGLKPTNSLIQEITSAVKKAVGFRLANSIECIHYYDTRYLFPYHIQVFYHEQSFKKGVGYIPVVKRAYAYEVTIYEPIRGNQILTIRQPLNNWNSRMSVEVVTEIGIRIKKYVDTVINTKHNYDLYDAFVKDNAIKSPLSISSTPQPTES